MVVALIDQVHGFPEVLPFAPTQTWPVAVVDVELPGIAQAVGIDFPGGRRDDREKRIVLRNRVIPARVRIVDVDPDERTGDVADILTGS